MTARQPVVQAVGEAGPVDAAAVAADFDAMDRVAGSTSVPPDDEKAVLTRDFRKTMGINVSEAGRHQQVGLNAPCGTPPHRRY